MQITVIKCAKIHHTAYLFVKKHGMGSMLLTETPVIKYA